MSEKIQENKMGTMPIGKLIISMSWPAILSMMIQALYNIVDSMFVSMIGEEALSAVTYIFPIQMLIIAVAVGTGVGVNSLIARRLGAQRFEDADKAASHGYRLAFFNWIGFALIGIFLSSVFMNFFSDNTYIVENGTSYMRIITIGSLFCLVQISTEKILQATGSMVLPMICSIAGAFVNVVLDPVLIFGIGPFPEMGVTGAAVATIIGQFVSMTLGQIILFKKSHLVTVKAYGFKMERGILRDIYAVGLPAILMQAILSIMQFGVNGILSGLTETSVAVNGIYGRLQSFIFMPVFGLNQGALPVMGYNYGARNRSRLIKSYKVALAIAAGIMFLGLLLFQIFPHALLSIFNANAGMYEIGIPALRTISWCFLPAAFGIISAGFFQATGHGVMSLLGSLIRQLIGILPLAFIFSKIWGVEGVWWAFPFAEILGLTYCILAVRLVYKKDIVRLTK
ncbi:MAG: MATE family efflux transporter [Anaerovoracaceae bacterium]